jgi:chromosome transmission fidelity protein 8
MIIPINVAPPSSNSKLPPGLAKISHEEIVLIELQGTLEVECTHISESDGKLVGKLKIDEASVSAVIIALLRCGNLTGIVLQNKPTLLIGHHLLEGKIVTLPKPIAVLHRSDTISPRRGVIRADQIANEDEEIDVDDEGSQISSQNAVAWDVVAVVKRKILFSKRPMPVVGRTQF